MTGWRDCHRSPVCFLILDSLDRGAVGSSGGPATLAVDTEAPMHLSRWLLAIFAFLLVLPWAPIAEAQTTQPLTERVRARALLQDARATQPPPLGYLSANPYLPGSTSGFGSEYRYGSPTNPYGPYGSPYARDGARNPYTTGGARIVGQDGTYLGRLNANPYDLESVANPYGRYGSPFSPQSINNPFSQYGSPFSPNSATNPYATQPPVLLPPRR